MGAERKKGFVRNWILAHLRDGNGLVSPRSLGRLFEQAAGKDAANQSVSPPRLIHPTALRQALDDVSDSHVTQGTSSEWPWLDGVRTRLQNDRLVPWEQRKITGLLAADWDGRWAPEAQSQVRPPEDRPADFVDYLTELGTSASAPITAWMCPISTSPASTSPSEGWRQETRPLESGRTACMCPVLKLDRTRVISQDTGSPHAHNRLRPHSRP